MKPTKAGWNWKKWLIGLLVLATAFIHFYLNFVMGKLDILFTLNGLGYLGLGALYLLPWQVLQPYRGWIRAALIGFTLLTIILWVFLGQPYTIIGYVDKVIELLLLLLLVLERR
jgi:hypothetical protein